MSLYLRFDCDGKRLMLQLANIHKHNQRLRKKDLLIPNTLQSTRVLIKFVVARRPHIMIQHVEGTYLTFLTQCSHPAYVLELRLLQLVSLALLVKSW